MTNTQGPTSPNSDNRELTALPADCKLAYYLPHEAYYAETLFRAGSMEIKPHMMVSAAAKSGCGAQWEFRVTEFEFSGGTVRLEMFADAFDAFVQIPEFFARLVSDKPETLAAVRALLDELGAEDSTPRTQAGA